jgi:hypothetical protein
VTIVALELVLAAIRNIPATNVLHSFFNVKSHQMVKSSCGWEDARIMPSQLIQWVMSFRQKRGKKSRRFPFIFNRSKLPEINPASP